MIKSNFNYTLPNSSVAIMVVFFLEKSGSSLFILSDREKEKVCDGHSMLALRGKYMYKMMGYKEVE